MALYAKLDYGPETPSWDEYAPNLPESLGAAWEDALSSNPLASLGRAGDVALAAQGLNRDDAAEFAEQAESGDLRGLHPDALRPEPARLSLEDQRRRIRDAGLEGRLEAREGYTAEVLDILIPHKKAELDRRFVSDKAPALHMPFTLAAGLGASALDPINVATAFVPVVGQSRMLSLLGRARGAWGRAGVRAGVGAAEGAVGGALVEPLVYAGQRAVQADYDLTDSLLNIGFGAVMGAGLQPLAGEVGDFLTRRRGGTPDWALTERTDASEALRLRLSDEIRTAYGTARPDLTGDTARLQAEAAASLFDARARAWAYDTGGTAEDYYARYAPEFRAGTPEQPAGPDALDHAAILDPKDSRIEWRTGTHEVTARGIVLSAPDGIVKEDAIAALNALRNKEVEAPFGKVIIGREGIGETRTRRNDAEFITYAALPDIIRNAQWFRKEPNVSRGKGHVLQTMTPVVVGDETYAALTVFKNSLDRNGNIVWRYYGHRLLKTKDAPGRGSWAASRHPIPTDASFEVSLYDFLDSVKRGVTVRDGRRAPSRLPDDLQLLFQDISPSGSPRARVDFNEGGKAVITFFGSADVSSAPHELYHIFRREVAETAADPAASARAREQWAAIEAFAGAEPGKPWTADMEERFAEAGERFLLEGKAPNRALQGVFERLRQWFLELYADADAAGLEMSPAMRDVFNNMFSVPADEADLLFRRAVGDLALREWEQDFVPRTTDKADPARSGAAGEADAPEAETVARLQAEAETGLLESLNHAARSDPETAEAVRAAFGPELDAADADIARARLRREVMRQVADCELRR